jgi:hypothetical protein
LRKLQLQLGAGEVASLEKLWNQQCTKENVIAKIQETLVKPNVKGQPCEDCYNDSTTLTSGLIIACPTGGYSQRTVYHSKAYQDCRIMELSMTLNVFSCFCSQTEESHLFDFPCRLLEGVAKTTTLPDTENADLSMFLWTHQAAQWHPPWF